MERSLTSLICTHAAEARLDRLSPLARRNTCRSIADTLAVIAAASAMRGTPDTVRAFAERLSAGSEASLLGLPRKVCAATAAYGHGCMAHYLDYDDVEYVTAYHPSASLVPAAMALAEADRSLTGADLLLALAIGQDVGIRLARTLPLQRRPPWHRSMVVGTLATAITSAKLLRLDADGIEAALGHALNQAAGSLKLRWEDGSDAGAIYVGYTVRAGLTSAEMARAGIPSVRNALDGETGFFELYYGRPADRAGVTAGLGERFMSEEIAIKPWPACAAVNTYVASTLELVRRHAIAPDAIRRIELKVGDYALRNCAPLADRQAPSTGIDAKFSIPWCVAVAARNGGLGLADFTDAAVRSPEHLGMAARVDFVEDPAFDMITAMPAGEVTIETADGARVVHRTEVPYGHPDNPVDDDVFAAKVSSCLAAYGPSTGDDAAIELIRRASAIETAACAADLMDALRPHIGAAAAAV